MKILKIFGIVVGIHLFALILIFANPGCSSTTKPAPNPADTVAKDEPAPTITVPNLSAAPAPSPVTDASAAPAPIAFNPDAPATYAGGPGGVRFTPTRPNTPAASAVLTQPVENVTPATTYEVKSGDNLWSIAKKFHVSYKDIAKENNLKVGVALHQGQKLIIPTKSSSTSTASAPAKSGTPAAASGSASTTKADSSGKTANGEVSYTVKPGDTIEGIAKRYEVKWKDLAVHNNIDNPAKLRPGTVLSIPGWKSTVRRSSGGASSSSAGSNTPSTEQPATVPNVLESDQAQPAPQSSSSQPGNIPVIDLGNSSSTSTPKQ